MTSHEVSTAFERGWSRLQNGELLVAAESAGFDVFVTTDTNLKYQQNLRDRTIAIVVLSTPSWPRIERTASAVIEAIEAANPASFAEIDIP